MIGRASRWLVRHGARSVANTALRAGSRTVVDTALAAAVEAVPRAVPRSAPRTQTYVFNVKGPTTIYLRASHCRVTVRRSAAARVTVETSLGRAFGVELTTDQDDAGVYIVARRKPVAGASTSIDFVLTVPPQATLAFHLTPGAILFEQIDGMVELPAAQFYPPQPTFPHSGEGE